MNRADLQRLSTTRLREAKILFKAGEFSGAYYLAGYAVECALKACIAKETQRFEFPDKARVNKSHVHVPIELMDIANLKEPFRIALRANPRLQAHWDHVKNWSEQSRYRTWARSDARAMIDAVGKRSDGVLSWLKLHW